MATHLVGTIDVRHFGGQTLRIGDLNGDGAPDLLFVQNLYGTRAITCLTATTIAGEILWQAGAPSPDNGFVYGDLPVQLYDWDGDGRNEVLYVQQAIYAELHPGTGYAVERAKRYEGLATMIVLDALTGQEKRRFPLPAPADDSILFADLTGSGRPRDLIVKDRYWNMWGVSHAGEVLWHWRGSTGHYPAIGDIDGDGRDEVFVGHALIDHDGRVLFQKDWPGWGDGSEDPWGVPHHQDAACVVRLHDGTWRLLFGNHGVHCLDAAGRELWHHPLQEAQHVVSGRFRTDSERQFMVVDRGNRVRLDPATLYLFDLDGREVWRREQPPGCWSAACDRIDWFGAGSPDMALLHNRSPVIMVPRGEESLYMLKSRVPEVIYNGHGDIVDSLSLEYSCDVSEEDQLCGYYSVAADVWGDGRDEVIMFGPRGACIHANARPLGIPTLYNETLYTGQ